MKRTRNRAVRILHGVREDVLVDRLRPFISARSVIGGREGPGPIAASNYEIVVEVARRGNRCRVRVDRIELYCSVYRVGAKRSEKVMHERVILIGRERRVRIVTVLAAVLADEHRHGLT